MDKYNIIKHFAIGFDVLFVILASLKYFNYLSDYWNLVYFFYFVLAVNVWFLTLVIKKIPEHERDKHSVVYLSKYFFLLGLVVIVVNQFLKRAIINDNLYYIVGLIIALGFVTFYSSRDRVEKEIEQEKNKEERSEALRKEEFSSKFPRINRIWGLRSVVRWMYKEGWWFSVGLIAIVLVASFFIFRHLGSFGFQVDEIYHALIIKNFKSNYSLFKVSEGFYYYRGLLVSAIAMFFSLFQFGLKDEFMYRLPTACIGIVNIFLVYLLSKKVIGKKFALIPTFLFGLDSLFLIFDRYLRFYAPSITIMLILGLLYSKKEKINYYLILIISILSAFLLNEFFIFISLFFILVLFFNKKISKAMLLGFIILTMLVLSIYFYNLMNTNANFISNILSLNFKSDFMLFHIKWLFNAYPLVIISSIILAISFSMTKDSNLKKMLSMSIFVYFVIFFIIDLTNFNFTFRVFLFILPIQIILAVYLYRFFKNQIVVLFVVFLLFCTLILNLNCVPSFAGDSFCSPKYVMEKQPIIIDTRSPPLFVKSYIKDNNLDNAVVFSVSLNDMFYDYYFGSTPDYLVRWEGSIKDKKSSLGTPTLFTKEELVNEIDENRKSNKTSIVVTYATIYNINNPLYRHLKGFNPSEAPLDIGVYLENSGNKVYTGEDNYSSVYVF